MKYFAIKAVEGNDTFLVDVFCDKYDVEVSDLYISEDPNYVVEELTDKDEIIEALVFLKEVQEDTEKEKEVIGSVCVDSGQLMITDPCYLSDWKAGDFDRVGEEPDNNYAEACNASLSEQGHGQILKGLSLAFSSGYGDGVYDVVATKDREGRIIKVEIDMSL